MGRARPISWKRCRSWRRAAGLRAARLSDIDRRAGDGTAAGGWAVAATVATRNGTVRIGTGRDTENSERRVVRIDREPARSQAALAEHVGVVWLTPQMDRLFVDGPGGRRRFLDRLVLALDPAHAARVAAYEQALRERARLLRDGPADPVWRRRPRRHHRKPGCRDRRHPARRRQAPRWALRRGRRAVSAGAPRRSRRRRGVARRDACIDRPRPGSQPG